MKLINIGFGNMVSANRLVAIVSPESAPIKRVIQDARESGTLIDATYGRRTRAVIITDSDHIILSARVFRRCSRRRWPTVWWTTRGKRRSWRMNSSGVLVVFSGPSGSGKGTVLAQYFAAHPEAAFSVSATTRAPRPGEVDGVNYHFVSRERFEEMISQGEVLEYTQYGGNYYGSPAGPIREALEQGRDVVLEIEVEGAMQVRERFPEALLVFVLPPSF